MKFSSVIILFGFFLSKGVAQKKFQEGFYVDLADSVHHGLIKHVVTDKLFEVYLKGDTAKGFNKIEFKRTKNSKKKELNAYQIKGFAIGKDTFVVKQKRRRFDIGGKVQILDFFQVLRKGKISLYSYHHPGNHFEERTGTTYSNKKISTFFLEKGNEVVTIRNDVAHRKNLHGYSDLKKLLKDDPEVLQNWESKIYAFKDLDALLETYNARGQGKQLAGNVILFRAKDKISQTVDIAHTHQEIGSLDQNQLIEVQVENVLNFELCIANNCQQFTKGKSLTYLKIEFSKKELNPTITPVPEEEGEYYYTRINYLMNKKKK